MKLLHNLRSRECNILIAFPQSGTVDSGSYSRGGGGENIYVALCASPLYTGTVNRNYNRISARAKAIF